MDRMANILSLLLWASGTALGFLASADWLLLDRQRKWIIDRAADFWNWLDDQRELKYLAYLRKFRWQRFVVILYATIALIMTIVIGYGIYTGEFHDADTPHVEDYFLGLYVGSFVAALFMVRTALPRLLNWVTKTEGSWAYLWRSTLVMVATVAATIASLATLTWTGGTFSAQDWVTSLNSFPSPTTAFLFGLCGSVIVTLFFLILTSWVLVVLPVMFVLLLTILFRVAQFVAVRVAENPKGPQYALSALLAAGGFVVDYFKSLMPA